MGVLQQPFGQQIAKKHRHWCFLRFPKTRSPVLFTFLTFAVKGDVTTANIAVVTMRK